MGVAWSIDGLLASCSSDDTVKIWNPSSSGECLKTLKGHRWQLFAKRCMLTPHLRPLHGHRGRGVDSGGERRRRLLLTQFTTPKQCPDQQRQILVRRHHARFLQRGFWSKRQQRQAVECGNGRAAQEARGPQVTAFCQALRLDPPHRGRGVDSGGERRRVVPVKLTFEKMAAIASIASSSTRRIHRSSSVGRVTRRSGCGMLTVARCSRSSRATGNRILRKVVILPLHRT